jgi:hypothetical protein
MHSSAKSKLGSVTWQVLVWALLNVNTALISFPAIWQPAAAAVLVYTHQLEALLRHRLYFCLSYVLFCGSLTVSPPSIVSTASMTIWIP